MIDFQQFKKGMRFDLETFREWDKRLGFPSKSCPCIHVGGTNGKGSVTTKIAAALSLAGLKVGLYTSPHIATYRERIQINGTLISEEEAASFLSAVASELTFFEAMTLLAFRHFAEKKCDVTLLEVGMGGRLDATNIVTPQLSVITSISKDHTQYLGETLEQIAVEKAGIIKPGVPLLVGPKAASFPIFREKANPYYELTQTFDSYEEENRAIAAKALSLLPFAYDAKGLEKTPPARFQQLHNVILDVAHNPDGMRRLFQRLLRHGKKIHVLLAMGKDKEIEETLAVMQPYVDFFHLTQATTERAAPPELLAPYLQKPYRIEKNVTKAFHKAKTMAEDSLLVVTGTFYIMAEVRKCLGIVEPCDDAPVTPY